jgi:hypothetical protein
MVLTVIGSDRKANFSGNQGRPHRKGIDLG